MERLKARTRTSDVLVEVPGSEPSLEKKMGSGSRNVHRGSG